MLPLLTLLGLSQATLLLTLSDVNVRLEHYHMFQGEFPCFPANESGPHSLLRVGFRICNPTPEVVRLGESVRFVFLQIDAFNASSAPLPYLRDTHCLDSSPVFTRGSQFTLSPDCCSLYSTHVDCLWLDVSNATLPPEFDLFISLANESDVTFSIDHLELEHHTRSLVGPLLVPIVFLTIFLLCMVRSQILKRPSKLL